MKKVFLILVVVVIVASAVLWWLAQKPVPEKITYGMSFNTLYAHELGLDWKQTYDAILDELEVRHFRLAAHWPMIEPSDEEFNFAELDYQMDRAEEKGADVILSVGRRLPRWPECHVPEWAKNLSWEEQKDQIRNYINIVVNRYKDYPNITYWQVENEPYLSVFAHEYCGELDQDFLLEEIELVRSIDPARKILVTDSGNLGLWINPYRNGDIFGTSVYVYFWNPDFGQLKTILPPWWYRVKDNLMATLFEKKETLLIELALEPWLVEPVVDVDLETQYSRMDVGKIREIIAYASETRYDRQYLWGAEWWYWLHLQGHSEIWELGKKLFKE